MTLNEAKEFLEKMAANWEMSTAEKQAFLDWQNSATREALKALDEWHRQFLTSHQDSLDSDSQISNRNKDWLHRAIHRPDQEDSGDDDNDDLSMKNDDSKGLIDTNNSTGQQSPIDQRDQQHPKNKLHDLIHHLNFRNLPPPAKMLSKVAALLLLVLGCLYLLQLRMTRESGDRDQTAFTAKSGPNNLAPGADRATLTLANGAQIYLDSTNQRVLQFQNGNTATNLNGNILAYNQLTNVKQIERNQLTTPRGGQYQIQLADGTHVWLNSASSLIYPTAFAGKNREVQLVGEAYFEVAHRENQPFIVHTRQMNVQVLGTGFNIMAYPEEQVVRATLVHGSVRVQHGAVATRIVPGQQASLVYNQSTFNVVKVDVAQTIAWKEGEFWFKNTAVQNIMHQLSRWYNFDVVYQGDISGIRLSGVLAKQQNAEQLLTILQLTRQVKFDVHGKTITVSPYQQK